jgi:hypothetical protein
MDVPDQSGRPCFGLQLVTLGLDANSALVVVVAEPIACPVCGRPSVRWVVPAHQDRLVHRPDES